MSVAFIKYRGPSTPQLNTSGVSGVIQRILVLPVLMGLICAVFFLVLEVQGWMMSTNYRQSGYDCMRVTFLVNLMNCLTIVAWVFVPHLPVFRSCNWVLFNLVLISTVMVGFWIILLPSYYIGLSHKLTPASPTHTDMQGVLFFIQNVWNHTATPLSFFGFAMWFFKHKFRMNNVVLIKKREVMKWLLIFMVLWNLTAAISSFSVNLFPSYGVFSNYNPWLAVSSANELFDLQSLLIVMLTVCLASKLIFLFFCWWARKLQAQWQWDRMYGTGY